MKRTRKELRKMVSDFTRDIWGKDSLKDIPNSDLGKRYLINAYWENGYRLSMGDEKEVKETIKDMMTRSYDDAYSLTIWDFDDGGREIEWTTKIDITLC